jgi:flagellar hook-associated protein 1 FlgK
MQGESAVYPAPPANNGFESEFFLVPSPKITGSSYNTGVYNSTVGEVSNAKFLPPEAPGALSYSGAFYTKLEPNDYQLTFEAGGAYTIRRLPDNTSVASGTVTGAVTPLSPLVVEFDGISIDIGKAGNVGDRFLISPYSEAARNVSVNERVLVDPRKVAAGAPVRTMPDVANSGSMVLGQGVVGVGYSVPDPALTLTENAGVLSGYTGSWSALYSDGSAVVSGTNDIPLNSGGGTLVGFNINNTYFKVDGRPNPGDSFTIGGSEDAVQDGRKALLLGKLQTANTTADGTATYQTSYARLVADNGIRTREAKVRLESQQAVLKQAQNGRDALSAVNLDEEAANLMKFQQAYQAAAKVLEIGGTLFDTIISIR